MHSPTELWASLSAVMNASRRTSAWPGAALVAASIAALVGLGGPGPASGGPATYTCNTAAYVYDVPAVLSSPDTVATYVRGSPTAPEACAWVGP